jgi:hypothetical protein
MSMITCIRDMRPQRVSATPNIIAKCLRVARSAVGWTKRHLGSMATILFFTALMAVLIGAKAAIFLARMHH